MSVQFKVIIMMLLSIMYKEIPLSDRDLMIYILKYMYINVI